MKKDHESKEGCSSRDASLEDGVDDVGVVTVLFGERVVVVDVVKELFEVLFSWMVDIDPFMLEDSTTVLLEVEAAAL